MKPIGVAAPIAANLLFWPSLFVFAALRPDYSHLHKAVSELGAWGAPRMWAFNVLGYILPGALLAVGGWMIGRQIAPKGRFLPGLLALGGAMIMVAGLSPADMDHRTSTTTLVHLVGANGSLLAWLIALVLLAFRVRGPFRLAAVLSMTALALIVTALVLSNPHSPGLTQRLMFAVFFASYPALAVVVG